jgi:P27 family predicted phage terminase small subunit
MTGRKPSPANLLLTGKGGKVIGSNDPPSDPPSFLQGVALDEYNRLAALLAEKSLLSPIDSILLATFCQTYADYLLAVEVVRVEGQFITNSRGVPILHPAAAQAGRLVVEMRKQAAEWGLSPGSRSRLNVPPDRSAADIEFDKFLNS